MADDPVTILQFIRMLSESSEGQLSAEDKFILENAYKEGWIEAADLTDPGRILRRADAARILHLYLLHVLGTPDLTDISEAGILKDLYDCRVCVNHIAQVYLRGLMDAVSIPSGDRDVLIFDSQEPVHLADSLDIIRRIRV